jgi:5-methyltetrahydropteroyltriglutamate--homocysteine methyltransferase
VVERRVTEALEHVAVERLLIAPDCGMKYLPRHAAFEKLAVMARAASAVRDRLPIAHGAIGGGSKR